MAVNHVIKGLLALAVALSLTACKTEEPRKSPDTPREAAECVMESLKELDMDTLNACSDNFIRVHRNFFGLPVRREYRVFNELQQPGLFKTKAYRGNQDFARKLVENLEWEILEVREEGNTAEIDLRISNLDMAEVMGNYTVALLEGMVESDGMGLGSLFKELRDLEHDKSSLLTVMDSPELPEYETEVTVHACQEEDGWKVQLGEEFINAFMGNINAENCLEETRRRIEELERQYEEKVEVWAGNLEEKLTQ